MVLKCFQEVVLVGKNQESKEYGNIQERILKIALMSAVFISQPHC